MGKRYLIIIIYNKKIKKNKTLSYPTIDNTISDSGHSKVTAAFFALKFLTCRFSLVVDLMNNFLWSFLVGFKLSHMSASRFDFP